MSDCSFLPLFSLYAASLSLHASLLHAANPSRCPFHSSHQHPSPSRHLHLVSQRSVRSHAIAMGANGNNGDFKDTFDKLIADLHM